MPEQLSKMDIARIQMDRAIELFLTDKDYVSAITLAGAAEEVLGKILKDNYPDETTSLEDMVKGTQILSKGRCSDPKEYETKAVVSLINFFRDHLKHYKEDAILTFDSADEAVSLIDRAITNYWRITFQETPNMVRFKEGRYGARSA